MFVFTLLGFPVLIITLLLYHKIPCYKGTLHTLGVWLGWRQVKKSHSVLEGHTQLGRSDVNELISTNYSCMLCMDRRLLYIKFMSHVNVELIENASDDLL